MSAFTDAYCRAVIADATLTLLERQIEAAQVELAEIAAIRKELETL